MIKNLDKINIAKREKVEKGCLFVQQANQIFPVIQKNGNFWKFYNRQL